MIDKVRRREMFPTHMQKVDNQQQINGHFKRLLKVKSTVDNRTPKSFQKQTNSQMHKRTLENNKKRLELAVQKSLSDGLSDGERIRLSRISHEFNKEKLPRPLSTATFERFNSPSLDGLYERRHLSNDMLIRHRGCFIEAGGQQHHNPLINLNPIESKVRHDRNYYPPRRIQFGAQPLPLANSFKADLTWDHTYDTSVSPSHHAASRISFQPGLKTSSTQQQQPQQQNHHQYHEETLFVATGHLPAHSKFEHNEGELPYLKFVADVTKDILTSEVFSDNGIKAIFSSHLEMNQQHLDVAKMKALLVKLLEDLGVEKGELFDDLLLVEENKQKRQWSPGEEYSKMSNSPNAEDYDYSSISEAQSLTTEDIEDILRGKVSHLVRRLHQGQLKSYGEVEEPEESGSVGSYDPKAVAKLLARPVSNILELNEDENNSFEEETWQNDNNNDDTREDISEINSVVEELEVDDIPRENSFEASEAQPLSTQPKATKQPDFVRLKLNKTEPKKIVVEAVVVEEIEETSEVSSVASEPVEDLDERPLPDAEELRQRRSSFLEQFQAQQLKKTQLNKDTSQTTTVTIAQNKEKIPPRPIPAERRVRFTSQQQLSEEDLNLSDVSEDSVISTNQAKPIAAERVSSSKRSADVNEEKQQRSSAQDESEDICDLLEDSTNSYSIPKPLRHSPLSDVEDDRESVETPKALKAVRSALNQLALEDSDD